MIDIPRIFTISESEHRIHNPFTPEKYATLGRALRMAPGTAILDLGSGSGEMLCSWARDHQIVGTGVDMSLLFSQQATVACGAQTPDDFLTLPALVAHFGELGYDVVEMVLADQEGWDRYEAAKWLTMRRWLEANPHDDFAPEVRQQLTTAPLHHVTWTREYLGWGVFVLMAR